MLPDRNVGARGGQVPAASRKIALIIWSALCAGVAVFAALATALGPGVRQRSGAAPQELVTVAFGLAVVTFLLSRTVPGRITTAPSQTPDGIAVSRTIVAAALNEGSALFAVIVWMIGGQPLVLVALAISAAGLLLAFPSQARWQALTAASGPPGRPPLVR